MGSHEGFHECFVILVALCWKHTHGRKVACDTQMGFELLWKGKLATFQQCNLGLRSMCSSPRSSILGYGPKSCILGLGPESCILGYCPESCIMFTQLLDWFPILNLSIGSCPSTFQVSLGCDDPLPSVCTCKPQGIRPSG